MAWKSVKEETNKVLGVEGEISFDVRLVVGVIFSSVLENWFMKWNFWVLLKFAIVEIP